MTDKDINIHIRSKDTDATKRDVDRVAASTERLGKKTEQAGRRGAKGTEESTRKLGGMGRILGNLTKQVGAFFGAWLGVQGVKRVIEWLIEKLERIQQIQSDIYDKSVQLSQIGQDLETQTQTTGKQKFWTKEAISMTESGSLESVEAAKQMMISLDIAFGKQGGIQNKGIRQLGHEIAPFIGAMGMGGAEVSKLFELASTAGVEATPEAYKEFFAKVTAAYTSSKATDPGAFATGLQKGGTEYLVAGGSLDELLARFAAARMVTANENLAATLLEQTTRLSKGGREKARKAIERKMGVRWTDLSMDERMATFLGYVEQVPEAEREAVLVEQGFPEELAGKVGTVVSKEAKGVYAAAKERIEGATVEKLESFTGAYKKSLLGKDRASKARILMMEAEEWDRGGEWLRRLKEAEKQHEIDLKRGWDDPAIRDKNEAAYMVLGDVLGELQNLELEGEDASTRDYVAGRIKKERTWMRGGGALLKKAYVLSRTQRLAEMGMEVINKSPVGEPETEPEITPEPVPAGDLSEGQSRVINYNEYHDYSINLNPVAGNAEDRLIGPRFDMYA